MFVFVVLSFLFGFYALKRAFAYSGKLPPGPVNIPLLGSWEFVKYWLKNGKLHDLSRHLGDKYGPIIFFRVAFDTPVVFIRTYDVLKEAMKDVRLYGMSGSYLYQFIGEWDNLGVSFSDGSKWQRNRRFTIAALGRLGFNKNPMVSLATVECSKVVENLVELEGQAVDITKQITGATANVTLNFVMNHHFDAGDSQIEKLKESIFDIVSSLSHIQTYLDIFPWIARFTGKNTEMKRLEKALRIMYDFINKAIDEHVETLDMDNPRDFIDAYLLQTSGENRDTSIANLRVILKDLVLGSLEPVSIMLSWIILLLAKHPNVQERARTELISVLGPHRSPTVDDERDCPYTRAIIEETLRFITLTPINRHFTSMGATTLRGYHIPSGAVILADQHSMHHDPAVWGDPEVFRPERFLGADGTRLREQVRGFGIGPRVCVAEAHSRTLLFVFIAGLLRRVEFRLPDTQLVTSDVYYVASLPNKTLVVPYPR